MSDDTIEIYEERDDLSSFIHRALDALPLTVATFRVYAHLARRRGQHGAAWPSYHSIGEKCLSARLPNAKPDSLRQTAFNIVPERVDCGWIEQISKRQPDGGNTSHHCLIASDGGARIKTPVTQGFVQKPDQSKNTQKQVGRAGQQSKKRKATYRRRQKIRFMSYLAKQQGGWFCRYGETEIQPCPHENPMHAPDLRHFAVREHVISELREGKYSIENLVLACWHCNSRHKHKDDQTFKTLSKTEQKGG